MKYIKRPVTINAIQYTGDNINEIWDTFGASHIYGPVEDDPNAYIDTLEGRMQCSPGDWIIEGVMGELYPCKPDIFAATYEPASGQDGSVATVETVAHDPMCPFVNEAVWVLGTHSGDCECERFAKVRADEREKAAQRVEEVRLITSRPDGFLVYLADAIAAVRGES